MDHGLALANTVHVDDLKGAGEPNVVEKLITVMESAVGKCRVVWDNFEHCGIKYEPSNGEVYVHQHHCADQLRPIDETKIKSLPDDALVDPDMAWSYASLLGGLTWLTLTRLDPCIYIQALQRHARAPRAADVRRANKIVKYMRRKRLGIRFKPIPPPWRVVAVSDRAFRALDGESSGLALRGYILLLMHSGDDSGGTCQVLDFGARKQRRVCQRGNQCRARHFRTGEAAKLIQLAFDELENGTASARALLQRAGANELIVHLDLVIDAKSVYDAIIASDAATPTESSLLLHVCALREDHHRRRMRVLWCVIPEICARTR